MAFGAQAGETGYSPPPAAIPPPPPNQYMEPGNINLHNRPKVKNEDGTISTVLTMSYQDRSGKEVLIPTVSDEGKIMGAREAIEYWGKKGQHLGKFKTPEAATNYAKRLHEDQDKEYGDSK